MGAENKFTPVEHYATGDNRNFDRAYINKIQAGFVLRGQQKDIIAMSQREQGTHAVMEPVSPVVLTLPQATEPITILSPRNDFRSDTQLFEDQGKKWHPNPLLPI